MWGGRGVGRWVAVDVADSAGPVQEKRAVKGNGERGALWEVESLLRPPRAEGLSARSGAGDYSSQQAPRRRGVLPPPPRGGASCSPVAGGGPPLRPALPAGLQAAWGQGRRASGRGARGGSGRLFRRRVGRALSVASSFWLRFRSGRDRML